MTAAHHGHVPRLPALAVIAALLGLTLPGVSTLAAHAAAPAPAEVGVEVIDPADELSVSDESLLTDSTPDITFPDAVNTVDYVIFAENDENLNDTVREFGEEERPDLLTPEQDKYAPGHLIVSVGLDPQQMGVYSGDDVAHQIGLYDDGRLDGILDEMEEPLQQGNWAAGLLAGAQAAADPSVRREGGDGVSGTTAAIIGGSIAVLGVGAVGGGVIYSRRKKARTARERFDYVSANYGRVAKDLDAIDVRAHSLSSPLANDQLRRQWRDVKERFLALHRQMGELEGLSDSSPDSDFRAQAKEIDRAHGTVTEMDTAEENIERLSRMENGDADVRRRELTTLHEDVLEAEVTAGDHDETLGARLRELNEKVLALRSDLGAADFMDRYADLLGDHRVLVEAVQEKMYADLDTSTEHEAPRLHDSGWHPGVGYHNYVPFAVISSWHQADVSAAQAASSSANTNYSSPGFAGAGGSRGF